MGVASFGAVAMGLVGLIGVIRARRGAGKTDAQADDALARRMEMERRMASYLAARDDTKTQGASDERSRIDQDNH